MHETRQKVVVVDGAEQAGEVGELLLLRCPEVRHMLKGLRETLVALLHLYKRREEVIREDVRRKRRDTESDPTW